MQLELEDYPKHKWKNISDAAGILDEAEIFIDDSADLNIMELRAKARAF